MIRKLKIEDVMVKIGHSDEVSESRFVFDTYFLSVDVTDFDL
jgi:hypothetical protein